ncbi:MAG: hypothetical protein P0S94_02300 [Simkaniaceae bacterium]|nr:hypothetical protein [Simkaniaceae bacterium]
MEEKKFHPFIQVEAGLWGCKPPEGSQAGINAYVTSIESALNTIVDKSHLPPLDAVDSTDPSPFFKNLLSDMPIISYSMLDETPSLVSVTLIAPAEHTHGIGRYMCDYYSRWAIPGKQVPILSVCSLSFRFKKYGNIPLFFTEIMLMVTDNKDLTLMKGRLPKMASELKINIQAVSHARNIVSTKPLTLEQKKVLIQENIASLLDRTDKEIDNSIFEQMQELLIKASAEHNTMQLKDQLMPLLEMRPAVLDRDIYKEMQNFVMQLKDHYVACRELKYINRIVSYHYIFRKIIKNAISTAPQKRHISIKVLRTTVQTPNSTHPVLGVLVGINLIRENEIFEQRHLLQAIETCMPGVLIIPDSVIVDSRQADRLRTLYLEVKHPDHEPFSSAEIKNLRRTLSKEIKSQIESVTHTIFVHRNEEEVMRDILSLSGQLKYLHDIPQVIINFHQQTNFEISFTVIILRLLRDQDRPFKKILSETKTKLKIVDCDSKVVGMLRKRYPKESNVVEVRIEKRPFIRKDYSIDIYKARLAVFEELSNILGDLRDYNGGMLSQHFKVLATLKKDLSKINIKNDFLLENFFYSITPNYMQSLLEPLILKHLFLLLINLIDKDHLDTPYVIREKTIDNHYLLMIGGVTNSFKEFIFKELESYTPSQEIAHCFVTAYDVTYLGFAVCTFTEKEKEQFTRLVMHGLDQWQETVQCYITPKA